MYRLQPFAVLMALDRIFVVFYICNDLAEFFDFDVNLPSPGPTHAHRPRHLFLNPPIITQQVKIAKTPSLLRAALPSCMPSRLKYVMSRVCPTALKYWQYRISPGCGFASRKRCIAMTRSERV
jgi:hypothetical protein